VNKKKKFDFKRLISIFQFNRNMKYLNDKSNNRNKKKYLLQSLKPYKQINNFQSPIQQQFYQAHLNLIMILISLFILISTTISVYYISKYLIDK
jgi:hypothetical protein